MIDIPENIDNYLRKHLSKKRYEHTLGVVDAGLRLAARWDVDRQRTYYAALLHDCAKSLSDDELLLSARLHNIPVDEITRANPQLLHADIGAVIAKEQFGITDEKILSAIRNHTMGKEKMSGLEKVVFLADLIEENRSFEGVYDIRAAALEELDLGMLMGFESVIKYTKQKGERLHPRTVRARDYIKEHYAEEPYSDDDDEFFVYYEEEERGIEGLSVFDENEDDENDEDDFGEALSPPNAVYYNDTGDSANETEIIKPHTALNAAKAVIITGASGGIGSATAERFAREGYNTVLCYNTNLSAAAAITETLKNKGYNAEYVLCDVTSLVSVKKTADYVISKYGFVDVIVNNAGISGAKLFTDIDETEWFNMLNVNLSGAYRLTKELLPYMISEKKGAVVNVSSMWGQVGASTEVHYSAAKAGLIGLTKALAKELGPSGIRVNCVCPGVIDTKMNAGLNNDELNALKEETPLCRIGKPEEVASAIFFLAGEEASFITGEVLSVSGGFVI